MRRLIPVAAAFVGLLSWLAPSLAGAEPIAIEAANNVEIKVENILGHDNGGGRDSGCIFVGDGNAGIWIVNNICFDNGSTMCQ